MKQGKTLQELAAEIERQAASRRDVVADSRNLRMANDGRLEIKGFSESSDALTMNEHAHRQIGNRIQIPAKYYDRMRESSPELLAQNVNHWLHTDPEPRLVRTLDGQVRAFLSNRYQRIDNNHVAEAVLPILLNVPGIRVVSSEITESRMYLKAVTTEMREMVPGSRRVGDFVEGGLIISNSEIGMGALTVKPFLNFLVCTNGMVRDDIKRRFNHVGKAHDIIDVESIELSDDTRKLEDLTVLSKVKDVVRAALDYNKFRDTIHRLGETTEQRVEGDPIKAIEVLGDSFGFQVNERSQVLRHLIEGADLSRYGVINAVTRTAEDLASYDRATQFEAFGGDLLSMSDREWKEIATAA